MIKVEVPYDRKVKSDMCQWLENIYGNPVVHAKNVATGPTWRLYHTTKRDWNDEPVNYVIIAEFKFEADAAMFALRWG